MPDFPQPGFLISLRTAKEERRCRVCGEKIPFGRGWPAGWQENFKTVVYPEKLTLNFGKEFAHTARLEGAK